MWFINLYILVKVILMVKNKAAEAAANNAAKKKVLIKNFAPVSNCISRINKMQVNGAHDVDVVLMSMYNLIEYSDYSKTCGILWQYCRDVLANRCRY